MRQESLGNAPIRLGIIGLSDGNGHPYSWSAIFNGYDVEAMRQCPYPVIPEYLAKQTFPEDCIPNVKVTHIWTQERKISEDVADASRIEYIVDHYTDMIGEVDAILLARDDVHTHLSMSIPFLEAGLPVYIDKPIATNLKILDEILTYEQYPGQIFSCSALRFAKEFKIDDSELTQLGDIQYVEATIGKDWEKYGVHIIEPVLHLLKLSTDDCDVQAIDLDDKRIVIARWKNTVAKFSTLGKLPGPVVIRLYGTKGMKELYFRDTYFAFKQALQAFVDGIRQRRYMITHREMRDVVSIIERGML